MQDFERLGVFYLGRRYDLDARRPADDLVLYDAKDLTTHAVCVGMTGSGKTGLCLALLEEAAIDGIPVIAIDPKGDVGNLLLTFPELRGADFAPWIDPAEAAAKAQSVEQCAEQTAQRWREGLAAWGQDGPRIARYQAAAEAAIYTPGSGAGRPLSVLQSLSAPTAATLQDADALRERIGTAVSGLLGLMGVEADPLRSREHILLATILDQAWRSGRDLPMDALIRSLQTPPVERIGVMDLESFFPAKERFALAMQLNNLLASPGFAGWLTGEPLDVQRLLYTPAGRPRLSVLSIAHLSDAERMFFVSFLLNEVIAWMRKQPGTSSLRAILYMDEVFGFFPPTANPPSKTPMLTLLKQARAFGLGVVLATQNPVDLDYKGLSNAGTWLLGRLQTERDKARVLEGLEGAAASAGAGFDRQQMEATLAGLGNRVFLLNNVHEDRPVVFQSRWALSYLRGPLTMAQIRGLTAAPAAGPASPVGLAPAAVSAAAPAAVAPPTSAPATPAPAPPALALNGAGQRPVLPPGVPECFVQPRGAAARGTSLGYRPGLLGTARVHFIQSTAGVDAWQTFTLLAAPDDLAADDVWERAVELAADPDLDAEPDAGATFADLPAELTKPKTYASLASDLKDVLYRTRTLGLWKCAALKAVSQPDESAGDFRARLAHQAREKRDAEVEKLRAQYAPKLAGLQEQVRKAGQRVEKSKAMASQQTLQTVVSVGSSILGALFGRKLASSANVTRAAGTVRAAGQAARRKAEVGHAEDTVEAIQQRLDDLDAELKDKVEKLQGQFLPDQLALEEVRIKPKRTEIEVQRVALAWTPWRQGADGHATPAYNAEEKGSG